MNRRSLLKKSFAAGAVTLLPFSVLPEGKQQISAAATSDKPNGFKRFQLGDLELTIITDGYIKQSPVHPFVAPLADSKAVKELLEANFRPADAVELAMNLMIVKSRERLVLLDTGMGIFAEAIQGWLPKSMADAGFALSDVTDIIASHAHPDHIGGLVNKQGNLVFPNATIHISKIEYEFWQKATVEDFKKSPLFKMQDFLQQIIPGIQNILKIIQPKIKFIDLEKGLHDIFSFQLAPGHTPGLTMTTIKSKNEQLTFIADLIHSDVLLFAHPEWGFSGDTDLQQATGSRIKILGQLASSKTKTFAYHLPWPGLGHVRTKGTAFEWIPEVFATP